MFHSESSPTPSFTSNLCLDLGTVVPSMAGPKRPQDRVSLSDMKSHWRESLNSPVGHQAHGIHQSRKEEESEINFNRNLYNKKLIVKFIQFLRKEKKFKGINDLRKQINKDIKLAKKS